MGLEMGKNKNKMDGGLTTLSSASDSNTFVKLTVKMKDIVQRNTKRKHQRNTNQA